jgi:signal transduction histidine kinase
MRLSLRSKTFVSIISITALVLLLFDTFIIFQSRRLLEQAARSRLEVEAMALGQVVDDFLSSARENLEKFSEHGSVAKVLSTHDQADFALFEQYMQHRRELERTFSHLGVLDAEGNCLASTDPDWRSRNFSDEDLFASGRSKFTLGPIFDSPEEGKIQLAAAPVVLSGDVKGVVIGRLNVSVLFSALEKSLDRSTANEIFLLDRGLRFITPGRTGPQELVVSHFAGIPRFHAAGNVWSGRYTDFSKNPALGAIAKIPDSDWWLAVEQDYLVVMSQFHTVVTYVVALSVLLLLAAFVTGFFLSRSISRPLAELSLATQRISDGGMEQPVRIAGASSEINLVADALERMRQQLKHYQDGLIEKLKSAETRREESERMAAIGTMSAGLAHEIRNPLNAVSLLVAEMKLSTQSSATWRTLDLIESEISRLNNLVSDMLGFVRPQTPVCQEVDLAFVLAELQGLYSAKLASRNIALDIRCADEIVLSCDRGMIRQSLHNLLKNAVEAVEQRHPAGGGHITIDVTELDGFVSMKVSDNGVGFDPHHQGKLFDLFFSTKTRGNGFGLSEVLKFTRLHKGSIDLIPLATGGCVANLILPLSQN